MGFVVSLSHDGSKSFVGQADAPVRSLLKPTFVATCFQASVDIERRETVFSTDDDQIAKDEPVPGPAAKNVEDGENQSRPLQRTFPRNHPWRRVLSTCHIQRGHRGRFPKRPAPEHPGSPTGAGRHKWHKQRLCQVLLCQFGICRARAKGPGALQRSEEWLQLGPEE